MRGMRVLPLVSPGLVESQSDASSCFLCGTPPGLEYGDLQATLMSDGSVKSCCSSPIRLADGRKEAAE